MHPAAQGSLFLAFVLQLRRIIRRSDAAADQNFLARADEMMALGVLLVVLRDENKPGAQGAAKPFQHHINPFHDRILAFMEAESMIGVYDHRHSSESRGQAAQNAGFGGMRMDYI